MDISNEYPFILFDFEYFCVFSQFLKSILSARLDDYPLDYG